MKTSLIIPCYWLNGNLKRMTRQCLDSLPYPRPDEVIVVDDGSPSKMQPDCDLFISYRENKGYPHAVNKGLEQAKGDVIIIGNNDLLFYKGWLEGILKPLKEGYDVASIRTSSHHNDPVEEMVTEGDKFGCLWAMKREVYDKLGGFDERFGKGTFEDTDYRKRIDEAGYKVGKYHGVMVFHQGRATFDLVDPENKIFFENKKKFEEKHGTFN
jgi:GT2 family glycosyltransferase